MAGVADEAQELGKGLNIKGLRCQLRELGIYHVIGNTVGI